MSVRIKSENGYKNARELLVKKQQAIERHEACLAESTDGRADDHRMLIDVLAAEAGRITADMAHWDRRDCGLKLWRDEYKALGLEEKDEAFRAWLRDHPLAASSPEDRKKREERYAIAKQKRHAAYLKDL